MAKKGRRSYEQLVQRSESRQRGHAPRRHGRRATAGGGVTRRQFLTKTAAAGMMLTAGPLLESCRNIPIGLPTPPRSKESRTLFFNLSHENHAGKTYFLTGGGQRYTLTKVAERPEVLRQARQSNAFLRAVPDSQITHHVENALFAADTVTLCYVSADLNSQAGTWSMSAVQLYIPSTGAAHAYAQAASPRPPARCRSPPNASTMGLRRRVPSRTCGRNAICSIP